MSNKSTKMKTFITYLCCFLFGQNIVSAGIMLSGPGLGAENIVMPGRYYFIEVQDSEISTKEDFDIQISGLNKLYKPCRIWTEILDRKDNFFIIRYKMYEVCTNLTITGTYKGVDLGKIIQYTVLPDDCACITKDNINTFLNDWRCGPVPDLLETQLKEFGKINWDKKRQEIIENFDKPLSISICHYVIKNNEIFRKCYGKYVDFKMFVDKILLSLARKTKLPDIEFFTNLGDWPLSTRQFLPNKYPIFSWCGSDDSYDIVWPTYELTESVLENMGGVSVNTLSVQGNVQGPWETRFPQLFWRGRDSNKNRLELIKMSRKYPDLFNVSLTNFFFYKNEEEIYGPKAEHVSFYRFFDYKYQLAIDGTVAPYRMPFLLAGGSLIFKPKSKYFEHFYKELKPFFHYIPVNSNLSDLIEKIQWAQKNDEKAETIAKNAQKFANERISPMSVYCNYAHVLNQFSKILSSPVEVLEGMEQVNQPKLQDCDCQMVQENLGRKNEIQKDEL